MATPALATVVLDCSDAHELAAFYAELLGWPITAREPDWVLLRDPHGGTGLACQAEAGYVPPAWPERPGAQQKMLHLDFQVTDLAASSARAVAAGAAPYDIQPQEDVRVLRDPAGHPFCLFLH
ncbi:VOC family protein [Streptomyces oceani]|uniref:Glyoxalase n=1 Tax=Streptomyces oceani TaxID=1075402 RepID=A0A1E7KIC2_9ACTN|nr:VOC family protein [Streptomyces oceani]OEV03670.1 glyoxalase [Streptomyces oceani]